MEVSGYALAFDGLALQQGGGDFGVFCKKFLVVLFEFFICTKNINSRKQADYTQSKEKPSKLILPFSLQS